MVETEAVLLRRFARTGDAEAFGEIIRRHAGLVYGAAWRILADMDRASDVAQETFLQLTKDAAKVTGSLPGWLHRVATHKAIDLIRRDSSRKHREMQYAAQQPRQATAWREISPYVDEGLKALDTEMREILVAHFLEGQTTRQIAGLRGISQATVSRRLEAGVVKLRGRLRQRGVLVAVGTLSLLLGENAVNAAPAGLMTELGKMALVGGQAAALSASGAATAGTASGFQTVIGGALAGVKAKAVAATAVAAISIGSVVTYQQVTKSPVPQTTTRTTSVSHAQRSARRTSTLASGDRASASTGGSLEAAQEWERMISAALEPSASQDAVVPVAGAIVSTDESMPLDDEARPLAGAMYGGMMGGFAMAADPPADPEQGAAQTDGEMMGGMGMGGGYYASRFAPRIPGPNDANDPNSTSAQDR